MKRKTTPISRPPISTWVLILFACSGFIFIVFYAFFIPSSSANSQIPAEVLFAAFFSFLAALTSIWNISINQQNAARLEEFKQILSAKYPALEGSRDAALHYYRTLAKMERQKLDQAAIEDSEDEMAEAEGLIYLLDDDYRDAWYEFWQSARNIATQCQNMSKAEAQNYWRNEWARDMGRRFKQIAMYQI